MFRCEKEPALGQRSAISGLVDEDVYVFLR